MSGLSQTGGKALAKTLDPGAGFPVFGGVLSFGNQYVRLSQGGVVRLLSRMSAYKVLAALRGVHGQQTVDEEVSLYYLANEVATT
jgi:hypothetical protein